MRKNIGVITDDGEFPRSTQIEEFYSGELLDKNFAAEYLAACLEAADEPRLFPLALQDVIKANGGFTEVARKIGMQREALYRAVSLKTTPKIHVVRAILDALGIELRLIPKRMVRTVKQKPPAKSTLGIKVPMKHRAHSR